MLIYFKIQYRPLFRTVSIQGIYIRICWFWAIHAARYVLPLLLTQQSAYLFGDGHRPVKAIPRQPSIKGRSGSRETTVTQTYESSGFAYPWVWSSTISLSISEICFSGWCHSSCGISVGRETDQRELKKSQTYQDHLLLRPEELWKNALFFLVHGTHTTGLMLFPVDIHPLGLGRSSVLHRTKLQRLFNSGIWKETNCSLP